MEGFDCAQLHLIDALRSITNSDQGMHYPRWAAWWQKNKDLSQQQWRLDGFAAAGLHVTEPVDQRFALELIEQVGHNTKYLAFNARHLLANVPVEQRNVWTSTAPTSPDRFRRLGAIAMLRQFGGTDAEHILRGFSVDPDVEIRRTALFTLNESLRISLQATPDTTRILFSAGKSNWIRGLYFSGDTLIAAFRDGAVKAFDVRTFQQLWTRHVFEGAGDHILTMGNRIILAAQDGGLAALDQQGNILWQTTPNTHDEISRLIPYGGEILVVGTKSLEHVDPKTGEVISRIQPVEFVADADSSESRAFFGDKNGLHSMSDSSSPTSSVPHAIGISASPDSVCVISGGEKNSVACLAADTLSLRWTQPISGNGTWGHTVAPIQDGSRVLVPTNQDLTAFAVSDGSIQWTTQSSQGSQGTIVPTEFGFLIQNIHYELELRNPANGEVLRAWPKMQGVMRIAAHDHFAAIADVNGKLWIVNIRD
jgi:WD40 repeat protein